jgi:hypothetical protein
MMIMAVCDDDTEDDFSALLYHSSALPRQANAVRHLICQIFVLPGFLWT